MIAFCGAAVYFLRLVAKNRGYALLVGFAGAVVVSHHRRQPDTTRLMFCESRHSGGNSAHLYEEGEMRQGHQLSLPRLHVVLPLVRVAGLWSDAMRA